MSDDFVVFVEGMSSFDEFAANGLDVRRKANMAVNSALRYARSESSKIMRKNINFPARYLTGANGRLKLTPSAADVLEGRITGPFRARSLARFVTNPDVRRGGKLRVRIKPGSASVVKGAFMIRLRQGDALDEKNFNQGVAVRLKTGESLSGRRKLGATATPWRGLTFLYGPSVDQVFRDASQAVAPAAADKLEAEFMRLLSTILT